MFKYFLHNYYCSFSENLSFSCSSYLSIYWTFPNSFPMTSGIQHFPQNSKKEAFSFNVVIMRGVVGQEQQLQPPLPHHHHWQNTNLDSSSVKSSFKASITVICKIKQNEINDNIQLVIIFFLQFTSRFLSGLIDPCNCSML